MSFSTYLKQRDKYLHNQILEEGRFSDFMKWGNEKLDQFGLGKKTYQMNSPTAQPNQPVTQPNKPVAQPNQPVAQPNKPVMQANERDILNQIKAIPEGQERINFTKKILDDVDRSKINLSPNIILGIITYTRFDFSVAQKLGKTRISSITDNGNSVSVGFVSVIDDYNTSWIKVIRILGYLKENRIKLAKILLRLHTNKTKLMQEFLKNPDDERFIFKSSTETETETKPTETQSAESLLPLYRKLYFVTLFNDPSGMMDHNDLEIFDKGYAGNLKMLTPENSSRSEKEFTSLSYEEAMKAINNFEFILNKRFEAIYHQYLFDIKFKNPKNKDETLDKDVQKMSENFKNLKSIDKKIEAYNTLVKKFYNFLKKEHGYTYDKNGKESKLNKK